MNVRYATILSLNNCLNVVIARNDLARHVLQRLKLSLALTVAIISTTTFTSGFDWGTIGYNNYRVWYWYYDTEGKDRDACLKANPDIIKLPSDVPLETLEWEDLNVPAQQWVRRWFTAYSKETLARVRGKYSGNLKTPDSEITMDYQSLLTEAKDEKTKLEEELKLRLERLRPEKVMEREALLAENLNKQMKFRAFPRQIYVI